MSKILVIGSLNMDFVIGVDKMPLPGETILGKDFNLVPGGKGANQAYAMGKLGADVAMIGAVGNDEYGKKLLDNLNSVNVNTEGIEVIENAHTGCAFINVDSTGENNIVVISGANVLVSKEIIDKNISMIDNAELIVMQLEIPIETVEYVAQIASQKGKKVFLDPAPACNLSNELLEKIYITKPNETELGILVGKNISNEADAIEGAKILLERGIQNVVVTLGGTGSVHVSKDNVQKYDAYNVDVVDTTAAGDTFTAGVAKCISEGNTIEEAIKFGHVASAITVTKKGAQTSIPSREEIEQFINKIGRM